MIYQDLVVQWVFRNFGPLLQICRLEMFHLSLAVTRRIVFVDSAISTRGHQHAIVCSPCNRSNLHRVPSENLWKVSSGARAYWKIEPLNNEDHEDFQFIDYDMIRNIPIVNTYIYCILYTINTPRMTEAPTILQDHPGFHHESLRHLSNLTWNPNCLVMINRTILFLLQSFWGGLANSLVATIFRIQHILT